MIEEKKRSYKQIEAYIEINVNKKSDSDIIQEIMKDGLSELEIREIIRRKRNRLRNISLGFIIGGIFAFLIGVLLTVSSYEAVYYSGGEYYIFYGLIIVGVISFFIGVIKLFSGGRN